MGGGVTPANNSEIERLLNDLRVQFVALLVKLDADTLVNGTNYASTLTPTAAAVIQSGS